MMEKSCAAAARERMINRENRRDALPHSGSWHTMPKASPITKNKESAAEKARKHIEAGKKDIPQIMENPFPRKEEHLLHEVYRKISSALNEDFPQIREITLVYVFDEYEADRTKCLAQCNRFSDGLVAIGFCVSLMYGDIQKLKYIFMHELAHLCTWRHTEVFRSTLNKLVDIYNRKTGDCISSKYEEERESGSKKK